MRKAIRIDGKPVGKARPRFGNGHTYTPRKTEEYEQYVGAIYKASRGPKFAPGVPVRVIIQADYQIPRSASRATQEAMARGEIRPTVKPDADNVIKIILDGLNGIAWEDDRQVCWLQIDKYYSTTPGVTVIVSDEERDV